MSLILFSPSVQANESSRDPDLDPNYSRMELLQPSVSSWVEIIERTVVNPLVMMHLTSDRPRPGAAMNLKSVVQGFKP